MRALEGTYISFENSRTFFGRPRVCLLKVSEDAEKELLKLLQILNEMPQNTPDAAKKLSAKFAEPLDFIDLFGGLPPLLLHVDSGVGW